MIAKLLSWQSFFDFGLLILLLGIFAYFWRDLYKVKGAKNWIKTRGRISNYTLEKQGNSLWPKMEYTYLVADKQYTGYDFFLTSAHKEIYSLYARNLAYQMAKAYHANEEIDVYYNPKNPEEAVLDTTISHKLTFILAIIGAFIFIHLFLIISRFLR